MNEKILQWYVVFYNAGPVMLDEFADWYHQVSKCSPSDANV